MAVTLPAGAFSTSSAVSQGQAQTDALEAQRVMGLQEAVGKAAQAGAVPTGPQAAVDIGKQMQKESAAAKTQGMKLAAETAAKQKQLENNAARLEKAKRVGEMKLRVSQRAREQETELQALGLGLKQRLLDDQMQFKRDEFNRALMNDRQLADWAVMKSKNEIEYQEFEQLMQQSMERHQAVVEQAATVIEQFMTQQFTKEQLELDQQLKEDVIALKQAADLAKQRAKARQASSAAMWTSGGAIVGTVIGTVVSAYFTGGTLTAAGAAAGASIGGGIGGGIGSIVAGTRGE